MSQIEEKHGFISCETPWGKWYQSVGEVYIDVNVPAGTKAKEVQCNFQNRKLSMKVKGEIVIDGALPYMIHPDESTWTIEDNKIVQICLCKAGPTNAPAWKSLLQDGQYQLDPKSFDDMEQKLVLQKMSAQNPGFDFSDASVTGNYHGGGPVLRA